VREDWSEPEATGANCLGVGLGFERGRRRGRRRGGGRSSSGNMSSLGASSAAQREVELVLWGLVPLIVLLRHGLKITNDGRPGLCGSASCKWVEMRCRCGPLVDYVTHIF
jgi:hypothetical protein